MRILHCRTVGEAATVDAGARVSGAGYSREGEHQGAGEGHRAHRQDDRQVLRRQGEYTRTNLNNYKLIFNNGNLGSCKHS